MMVLIASDYTASNPYVKNIVDALRDHCSVNTDVEAFWKSNSKYDIVHIQWPEEIFNWSLPSKLELDTLISRLDYWKNIGTKIVATRHNERSHRNATLDDELYNIIYNNADAVVHLGMYSYDKYRIFEKKSVVIEHPLCVDMKSQISSKEARKVLSLDNGDFLVLSVGAIRKKEEQDFLIKSFFHAKCKHKKLSLIVLNSLNEASFVSGRRRPFLKIWLLLKDIVLKEFYRWGKISLVNGYIDKDLLSVYLTVADCLFVPRIDTLNSGVVFLGLTFRKHILGPAIGNIEAVLKETGNYTFSVSDKTCLSHVIENILDKGEHVVDLGRFDVKNIAEAHFHLYRTFFSD